MEAAVPPREKLSAKDANVQRARVNKAPAVSSRLTTASAGVTAEQLQEELSEGKRGNAQRGIGGQKAFR